MSDEERRLRERRSRFLEALLDLLVNLEAGKNLSLSLPAGLIPWAREWQNLRTHAPLSGYYPGSDGRARARKELADFFGWEDLGG